MLGAIIGDIVGSRFEFNNTHRLDFELFTNECSFTDDTICTVAVADAILRGVSFEQSLLEWCRKYPNPKGAYGGLSVDGFILLTQNHTIVLVMVLQCEYLPVDTLLKLIT